MYNSEQWEPSLDKRLEMLDDIEQGLVKFVALPDNNAEKILLKKYCQKMADCFFYINDQNEIRKKLFSIEPNDSENCPKVLNDIIYFIWNYGLLFYKSASEDVRNRVKQKANNIYKILEKLCGCDIVRTRILTPVKQPAGAEAQVVPCPSRR